MPQDQDDIKGADAMKQAPTPGPLSGDDELIERGLRTIRTYDAVRLLRDALSATTSRLTGYDWNADPDAITKQQGDAFAAADRVFSDLDAAVASHPDIDLPECGACNGTGKIEEPARTEGANQHSACVRSCDECDGCGFAPDESLAPTAPVEASGSEQLRARATHGEYSLHNFPDDPDADHSVWSIFHTTESGGMEVASGMERATADLLLAATREVPIWIKPMVAALEGYEADYGGPLDDMHELGRIDDSRSSPSFRIRVGHVRALARLSARPTPVASGGQHSSATDFPPDDVLACVPVAETAGEAVAKQWRAVDEHGPRTSWRELDWRSEREAKEWEDSHSVEYRPLYAAPVPAQDDDKLRIACETARDALKCEGPEHELIYQRDRFALDRIATGPNLQRAIAAALKSTAAQEGGE